MKALTTRNRRSPQNGTEAPHLRRAAALILLFNALLLAWALFEPVGNRVSAIVVNVAGFVGPLLVLPLCFGGLLAWVWRRGASRTNNLPAALTGQRLAPVLLSMGILSGPIRKFFDAPYRSCKTEDDEDFAGNLIAHRRESINEIELRTTKDRREVGVRRRGR